jgi:hypothetical protein
MSKTVELPDDVYTQLEHQASLRGLTLPQIIAELVYADEKTRMVVAIERMRLKGLPLTPSSSAPPAPVDFEPVAVQGKPLSEVTIEERR